MLTDAPACTLIDGFRCYAPELATSSADYPREGFEITMKLEAQPFWCRARNRILCQTLSRHADLSRPIDMLEIGCGIGGVIAALRTFDHVRLTGSEIHIEGLRAARSRFPDIEFIQLDATRMPFTSAFDVIGAFDVIEHVEADEAVMAGVHQALRANGLFLVTVPQHPWMFTTLDRLVGHKRRYTRSDLVGKLTRNGFDVLAATSFVTTPFPAMVASRLLARTRDDANDVHAMLTDQLTIPPIANRICDWLMRIDEAALRVGVRLPFGGSLLAVARKR